MTGSRRRRLGAVAAAALLTACSGTSDDKPAPTTQGTAAGSTTAPQAAPTVHKVGEPFTMGDLRLTLLKVQDPFPTGQPPPGPGNRLVSIQYEVVAQSSEPLNVSALPSIEVRDSTGARYQSQHGRLGAISSGRRMENNALFEVPASATGLRVLFAARDRPGDEGAVVILE